MKPILSRDILISLSPNEVVLEFITSLKEVAKRNSAVRSVVEQIRERELDSFLSSRAVAIIDNTRSDFDDAALEVIAPYYLLGREYLLSSSKAFPSEQEIESTLSAIGNEIKLDEIARNLKEFGEISEVSVVRFPSFRSKVLDAKNDLFAILSESNRVINDILGMEIGSTIPLWFDIITIIVIIIIIVISGSPWVD